MKQVYNDIIPDTGIHIAGICSLTIAPREWVQGPIVTDFKTSNIVSPVTLVPGRNFIRLQLLQDSYSFTEKAKDANAGQYWDTEISGESNSFSPELLQTINTLRYCRFIAIAKDRKGKTRVVGDFYNGLTLMFGLSEINKDGGEERLSVSLTIQTSKPAPYLIL